MIQQYQLICLYKDFAVLHVLLEERIVNEHDLYLYFTSSQRLHQAIQVYY